MTVDLECPDFLASWRAKHTPGPMGGHLQFRKYLWETVHSEKFLGLDAHKCDFLMTFRGA
jgi:hypothetical protein